VTVDTAGIEIAPETRYAILYGGTLTSTGDLLKIHLASQSRKHNHIMLDLVIRDSGQKMGISITGNNNSDSGFYLLGDRDNTFTGNVEISGRRKHLVLRKSNGAIAVRSNITVSKQAILRFEGSNQLLKTSSVTLRSYAVLQNLCLFNTITNTFKSLIIDSQGILAFDYTPESKAGSKSYIKVDDLIINQCGHLYIQGWKEYRDYLLVRKTSANLADALTKMAFGGYDPSNIHLEDFDAEYWAISATPEPAITGAILGAAGLGLWAYQKRRRWHSHSRFP